MNRLVHFPPKHNLVRGDAMGIIEEYKFGNTTVRISNAYYANKSPEQDKVDRERLEDALYALVDHLIEQGEAV